MIAGLLIRIHLNSGKPVYGSTEKLLDNRIAKVEEMRTLYVAFRKFVIENFPNATVLPKKTYISILEKREFAAINVKKG